MSVKCFGILRLIVLSVRTHIYAQKSLISTISSKAFLPSCQGNFQFAYGDGLLDEMVVVPFCQNFRLIEMGLMTDFSLSEKRASTLRLCPSTKPVLLVQVPLCKRAPQTNLSM